MRVLPTVVRETKHSDTEFLTEKLKTASWICAKVINKCRIFSYFDTITQSTAGV